MVRKDLNLEELEWSEDEGYELNEEAVVRSTVETLQQAEVDALDIESIRFDFVGTVFYLLCEQSNIIFDIFFRMS